MQDTAIAQPALFVVEYALAQLWMQWGVRPAAMIGHSLGEYVAACLAGVFSLEDALALVAARGRLMQELPPGAMLAVPLPEDRLTSLLGPELDLAAVNGPALCTISGPPAAVEECRQRLVGMDLETRRLVTSHAFHSAMMEPIVESFRGQLARCRLQAPEIPFLSNLTGTWITAEEAVDPEYWCRHLRQPVRFAAGIETLVRDPHQSLLEVGPGRTLSTLVRRHPGRRAEQAVISSLRHPRDRQDDLHLLIRALGQLWLAGIEIDWDGFYAQETRRRLPLPTYPFERRSYWVEPRRPAFAEAAGEAAEHRQSATAPSDPAPSDPPSSVPPSSSTAQPRPLLGTAYQAPRNDLERQVAELWQELMGLEPIGVEDDFFELGGHSLLATEVTARLRRAFGVDIALRDLFEDNPTVARVATLIGERLQASEAPEEAAVELPVVRHDAEHRFEPFPLTDVQHAYWIGRSGAFELGNVGTHAYSEYDSEGLDPRPLERALQRLIERHDMLRAIVLPDGRQQVLADVPPYEIRIQDLRGQDPAQVTAALLEVRAEMSHQVLAADRWPLFDIRVSRWDGGERLHLSFDFLIGDAWSWQIIATELRWQYAHPDDALESPAATFRDYVLAEKALESSELYPALAGILAPSPT